MCEIDWSYVASFSKEMLTPVIGFGMFYIAWQQAKTNRQKLDLDCYDRRKKIYEEIKQIIRVVIDRREKGFDDLLQFYRSVSEADFLFESEISNYIDEIYNHSIQFQEWCRQYKNSTQRITPDGYNHTEVCKGMLDEELWLMHQFEPAKQKFMKYLKLDKSVSIKKFFRFHLVIQSYFTKWMKRTPH